MTDDDRIPGTRLRRFAERTFDRTTLENVMLPALADLQHECSVAQPTRHQQWLTYLRAYWGLWKTIGLCVIGDAIRDRDGIAASLGGRTIVFLPILVTVLMMPSASWVLSFGSQHGARSALTVWGFLMPASVLVALPAAFFFAIAMYRVRADMPSTRLVPSAIVGSIVCAAVVFALMMFVVPTTNQAFRTFVFETFQPALTNAPRVPLRKGFAEMTWPELNDHIQHAPSSRQAELALAHRQQRFAFVATGVRARTLGTSPRWPLAISGSNVRLGGCRPRAVRRRASAWEQG